jgi:prolyl 4-hydroxylase
MHHANVTKNYAWLPWNMDPSIPTPEEYKDMPVQPLGDRQKFYDDTIQGCVDEYGEKGYRCLENERDRVEMALRQPMVGT